MLKSSLLAGVAAILTMIFMGFSPSQALEGDSLWSQNYGLTHQWTSFSDWMLCAGQNYTILGRTSNYSFGNDFWLFNINQQGEISWSQVYDNLLSDAPVSVQTTEGGYILGGTSYDQPLANSVFWVVRTDAEGDCLWSQSYGSPDYNVFVKILPCENGGFLLGGNHFNYQEGAYDIRLFRLNSTGDTLWTRSFKSPYASDWVDLVDMAPVGTNDWLLLGWINGVGLSASAISLIRLDDQGDTLWTRTYGYPDYYELPTSMIATPDGFLLNCQTFSPSQPTRPWFIKINVDGDSLWSRSFSQGGIGDEQFETVITTQEGDFLAAGEAVPGMQDYGNVWLMKISSEGDSVWSRSYGQEDLLEQFLKVIPTSDNGYLTANFTAPTSNPDSTKKLWLVKINVQGDSLWSRSFQADNELVYGVGLLQGNDGDYRVIRNTYGTIQTPGHVTLQCLEGPPDAVTPQPTITPAVFKLNPPLPNPFNPTTTINYELPAASFVSLKVYDTVGRLVETLAEGQMAEGSHKVTFDGSGLPSGVYLYRLNAGENSATRKMVLLK
jgi:hypothetical protein